MSQNQTQEVWEQFDGPCDPMLHIKTKHPNTYQIMAKYCMIKDVRSTITRAPSGGKDVVSFLKATIKGSDTKKLAEKLREQGIDVNALANAAADYPFGKTFVVPQANKNGIEVDFAFADTAEVRYDKKKKFWNVVQKHFFACDATRLPEQKKIPVVNGMGDVIIAERKGNVVKLGNTSFEIDASYKPPIPKVVLASTGDANFHEHPKSQNKTGGCVRDCPNRCDFTRLQETLELYVIPMLAKAIAIRRVTPQRKDPFFHTQQAIGYIVRNCPDAKRMVTPHPLVSLCLMLQEPGLVDDRTRSGLLIDEHLQAPSDATPGQLKSCPCTMDHVQRAINQGNESALWDSIKQIYEQVSRSLGIQLDTNARDQLVLDHCCGELARAHQAVMDNRLLDSKICALNALKTVKQSKCDGGDHPVAKALLYRQLQTQDISPYMMYRMRFANGEVPESERVAPPQTRRSMFTGGSAIRSLSIKDSIKEFIEKSKMLQ